MPSLIPGYTYDIFISYRQKDNKGERWVSEFVEALKTELESTFKEEISVYFDVNPLDGLLETHDVNESLKEKLKCLVFIPIISRTYCDPKSFAWEHELKSFVEQASRDQFGLKIKLPGGNVASRILPVRIHDLDIADIKEFESVLGSVLRGVEFIYKEPGINRSLLPGDHEEKNLNRTSYRNQINKVTLAIKEIISGLTGKASATEQGGTQLYKQSDRDSFKHKRLAEEKSPGVTNNKLIAGILILGLILTAGLLGYSRLFPGNPKLPLVIIMDAFHPWRVYDTAIFKAGATNADVISKILDDLPVMLQKETISPIWERDQEILNFKPYLIIIHYSGFNHEDQSEPRVRLKQFISFFKNSDTRFLIYSRSKEKILREKIDNLMSDLKPGNEEFLSHIEVFGLDDHGSRSWLNPVTANDLKLRVKEMLERDHNLP